LGFYAGWPNALGAGAVTRDIFTQRGIRADQLPLATAGLLPLAEVAEAARKSSGQENYGAVAPRVLEYTTDVVFRDLWLRTGLSPRDRSLVTVSALITSGQVPQITYHLGRAMDNGLTREQASEALTQLACLRSSLPAVDASACSGTSRQATDSQIHVQMDITWTSHLRIGHQT
jgi:4-carboxymuconolactone decarboxylase